MASNRGVAMFNFISIQEKILVSLIIFFAMTSKSFAVFNGEATSEEITSKIVNIKFFNGACSAVVLSPRVLLTAAHCQDRFGAPELAAFIQPSVKTKACDIAEVGDSAYEPSASPTLPMNIHAPDILMIRLKTPLCSVTSAKLQPSPLQPGDKILQAGHGGGSKVFGQSHQVLLQIVDSSQTASLTTPRNNIERRLLKASAEAYLAAIPVVPFSSVCHGDSGGPSFVEQDGEMLLYGVNGAVLPNTELGSKCSQAYVHLITPVQPYFSWIKDTLLEWNEAFNNQP